jgi:hypothetical protein
LHFVRRRTGPLENCLGFLQRAAQDRRQLLGFFEEYLGRCARGMLEVFGGYLLAEFFEGGRLQPVLRPSPAVAT